MYRVGQKEVDAIAKVLLGGELFRYRKDGQCGRFERRWAKYLGTRHALLTASGTAALTAALVGVGVGPGDEVLVPACTYMATAIGVLGAGAIPVVVDIDESITLDPRAVAAAAGPRTRAVVPVHMWGLPCNMRALQRVARKHNLIVVEDACQAVGGGYEGRKLGTLGRAGAFSFNFYKNITCGEGGAVVTADPAVHERACCMVDCCNFYWNGRPDGVVPFACNGARASELEGAMLNAQLGRLDPILRALRRQKGRILRETDQSPLVPIRHNSPDHECGSHVMYILPSAEHAEEFRRATGGGIAGKTGRHVYTEWDPLFAHQGGPNDALNPYKMPANRPCRKTYTKTMCARSLDILNRTVMFATHPDRKRAQVTALIRRIRAAARDVLG